MQKFKIFSVISCIVVLFLLTGCFPQAKIRPEAFGGNKKFAIVSISGTKHFNAGSKTTKEFFTGYDESNDTQPILDKMRVDVWKALKNSKHFTLVDPKKVRGSRVYKEIEPDKPEFGFGIFKAKLTSAKDYKHFSDKQKFAKLAKGLNVDGVIHVFVNLSTRDRMFYAVGVGAKKTYAHAIVTIAAYDRNGDIIWQDSIQEHSEDGVSKVMILVDTKNINYKKMLPFAEQAAQAGISKLTENLNAKI